MFVDIDNLETMLDERYEYLRVELEKTAESARRWDMLTDKFYKYISEERFDVETAQQLKKDAKLFEEAPIKEKELICFMRELRYVFSLLQDLRTK